MSKNKYIDLTGCQFVNNYIYIINLLGGANRGLYEQILDLHENDKNTFPFCEIYTVETAPDLLICLGNIKNKCEKKGISPLIIIDSHGDIKKGICIAKTTTTNGVSDSDFLGWKELIDALRQINIVTKNNLGVFMSCCHGLHNLKEVTIFEPCPYHYCIGTKEAECTESFNINTVKFISELFNNKNIDPAISSLAPEFSYFHAELAFGKAFKGFIKKSCKGSGKQARLEYLLTDYLDKNPLEVNNRETRRRVRSKLRGDIKPNNQERHFNKLANIFLHGSHVLKFKNMLDT